MLEVVPIEFAEVGQFILEHHRHHSVPLSHKFSVAISDGDAIRGVAVISRPIARHNDNGWTLEVTRCCTDGVHNGCSMLYGAAWRAAKALGFRRLITYTLETENGSSLRGAGWRVVGSVKGRTWNTPSRPRVDTSPRQNKLVWEA